MVTEALEVRAESCALVLSGKRSVMLPFLVLAWTSLNGGGRKANVRAVGDDGAEKKFTVLVRVDTPQEVEYYRNGGILPYVLRQLAG